MLSLLNVQIFLDALEVIIQAINGLEDRSIKAICQYISCVSSHFDSILFFYIPRDLNRAAHLLSLATC